MNYIRLVLVSIFFFSNIQNAFSMDRSGSSSDISLSSSTPKSESNSSDVQVIVDSAEKTKAEIKRQEVLETWGQLWERIERMKEAERQQKMEESTVPDNHTTSVPKVEGEGRFSESFEQIKSEGLEGTISRSKEEDTADFRALWERVERMKESERQQKMERSTVSDNHTTTSVPKAEGKGRFSEAFEQIRSEGLEGTISRSKEEGTADFRALWERVERMKEAERQQKETERRIQKAHMVSPTSIDRVQPSLLRQLGAKLNLESQSFNKVPRQPHEQRRSRFSIPTHLSFDTYSRQSPMIQDFTRFGSRPVLSSNVNSDRGKFGGVLSTLSEKVLESTQNIYLGTAACACARPKDEGFASLSRDARGFYSIFLPNADSREQDSYFREIPGHRSFEDQYGTKYTYKKIASWGTDRCTYLTIVESQIDKVNDGLRAFQEPISNPGVLERRFNFFYLTITAPGLCHEFQALQDKIAKDTCKFDSLSWLGSSWLLKQIYGTYGEFRNFKISKDTESSINEFEQTLRTWEKYKNIGDVPREVKVRDYDYIKAIKEATLNKAINRMLTDFDEKRAQKILNEWEDKRSHQYEILKKIFDDRVHSSQQTEKEPRIISQQEFEQLKKLEEVKSYREEIHNRITKRMESTASASEHVAYTRLMEGVDNITRAALTGELPTQEVLAALKSTLDKLEVSEQTPDAVQPSPKDKPNVDLIETPQYTQEQLEALPVFHKNYELSEDCAPLLQELGIDAQQFTECHGNEVKQKNHKESLSLLETATDIFQKSGSNSTVKEVVGKVISIVEVGNKYNQHGFVDEAHSINEIAESLIKCTEVIAHGVKIIGQGAGEIAIGTGQGITQGVSSIAYDFAHPIETTENFLETIATIKSCVAKVEDEIFTLEKDFALWFLNKKSADDFNDNVKQKIDATITFIDQEITRLKESETPVRDVSRGLSALATEILFTHKINVAAGKALEWTKIKLLDFAKQGEKAKTVAAGVGEIAESTHSTFEGTGEKIKEPSKKVGSGTAKKAEQSLITEEAAHQIWRESKELQELNRIVGDLSKKISDHRFGSIQKLDMNVDQILKLDQRAAQLYKEIRTANDIVQISKNTNIPENIIQAIKNHVFFEEHILRDGIGKFPANIDMANAWKRLTDGNFVQSDLRLLQHEFAESLIMRGKVVDWETAHHKIVNKIYDWNGQL